MQLRSLLALSLVPLIGTYAGTVLADPETSTDKELSSMVVSASRSQTKVEDLPLHATVITQEEIQRSPAQTLDQLLRNVPGMNFTGVPAAQSDPTGHQTKMRGMGNAKVLVLLDGVPIHDAFYLTTQWFKVPLSNIERVEVVRGGASSLWGSMATAGVVNIISKRPQGYGGEFSMSAGEHGTTKVSLAHGMVLSDTLGLNIAIDQFQTDGYQQTPQEHLWRFAGKNPTGDKNSNVQITAFFRPNADLDGYLRIGNHVQDQDISYQLGSNVQKSPDFAAGLTQRFDKTSSITAYGWAQSVNFQKYNGAACYMAGASCPTSSSVVPANVNRNIYQYYSQFGSQHYRERGGSVTYSKALSGLPVSFQVGADYRRLTAADLEFFFSTPTAVGSLPLNSITYGSGEQTFIGLFGQASYSPFDALELTLSGRSDRYRMTDRTNSRRTAAGVSTGGNLDDSSTKAFSPNIGARFHVTNELSVRGSGYRSFRAPGFNNITRTYGTGTSTTIANPNLERETLEGWELGADFDNGKFSLGATYFLNNIRNMIATYTVRASAASIPTQVTTICGAVVGGGFSNCGGATTTSVKYYTNDQDGQAHGLELEGKWRIQDNLTLEATFTHTDTYLTRRGTVVTDPLGVQLAGVPKDVASLGVSWQPDAKWRTYAELRYIGPMYYDTTSINNTYFGQDGATIVNASLGYKWDKSVEMFATANNLFDKEYSESTYSYNQPWSKTLSMPRNVMVGFKVRY